MRDARLSGQCVGFEQNLDLALKLPRLDDNANCRVFVECGQSPVSGIQSLKVKFCRKLQYPLSLFKILCYLFRIFRARLDGKLYFHQHMPSLRPLQTAQNLVEQDSSTLQS